MHWLTMVQSVLSTVISFVVWSVLVYAFYLLRNTSLERKLARLIQPERSVPDEDRVHVVAVNGTDVRVTVRDVRLIAADDTHISLTYLGDTGDIVRSRRKDDLMARRRNPTINRNSKAGLTERNFVELPAETAGLWALTATQVDDLAWQFRHCILVIDYPTLLGTRKLMMVEASAAIVTQLNDDFARYIAKARHAVLGDSGARD